MTFRPPVTKPIMACALACALLGGCAGLPRIDPTGERILIWPKDQPQAATLLAPATTVVAPPVTTDPFFPQGPVVAAPGAVATVPGVTPASVALAQLPQDEVSITPERILAPVNSEVVLKASVCTTDGYTLADQKVEWMLGRNGVGQFVEVSGKGLFHPPLLPWNKPKKVDNYLATGWTANAPLCVTRGTADPSDDVNVNRGDAWVSISSANEGTSFVTAYMPTVESWETRRGAATIYWVDVQWVFPPSTIAGTGRPETLTTTVTRQTNGTPVEGWIVKYAVNDGGGSLSGGSGQVVEMRTDAQGRATVQVSPTASGAASSRVDVELIRPAGLGGDAPRLVVGTGATVIQWTGASTPYLPDSTSSSQPTTPRPSLPDAFPTTPTMPASPPGGWTAPSTGGGSTMPAIPTARPQLQIEFEGAQTARVGDQTALTFRVVNVGNATATNVKVVDRFDRGLAYADDPGATELDLTPGLVGPSIAAGDQIEKTVDFAVNQPGRLCHNVTAQCAEGAADAKQFCVTAERPREERTGQVRVTMDGPVQQDVGQAALFRITVENIGQLPLVDIDVTEEYPTSQLRVKPSTDLNVRTVSGKISRRIPQLEVGTRKSWTTECLCLTPTLVVMPMPFTTATARTDPPTVTIQNSDDHRLEIRPANPLPGSGAGPGGAAPPAGGAANALGVSIRLFNQPALVGARANCEVVVANKSSVDDENVVVRVVFPPELTPDVGALQAPPNVPPNVRASLVGGTLTFTPVALLRPTEKLTYLIPMNVNASGVVDIVAGAASKNAPQGVSFTGSQEITP